MNIVNNVIEIKPRCIKYLIFKRYPSTLHVVIQMNKLQAMDSYITIQQICSLQSPFLIDLQA